MKALTILKILKSMTPLDNEELQGDFNEAIAELEALLEPKTCASCKLNVPRGDWFVCTSTMSLSYVESGKYPTTRFDYCCANYEPKDK